MATKIDEGLQPFDVRDSYVLTRIIERRVKETEVYDVEFAPIVQTESREVKLQIRMLDAAGLAPFKADNANTPVMRGGGEIWEEYLELALIAEKDVLKAKELIDLASPDQRVAKAAARSILDRGVQLRVRNMNRTRWMAWQAVKDALTIIFPDGVYYGIDYDLDGSDLNSDFTGSHLPTAVTGWNDASATIIDDLYTWTKLIADDVGIDPSECKLHVNSAAWRYMKKNTGLKAELSATQPRIITPKLPEVVEILGIGEIVLENRFWTDTDGTKTKFLPDGYALITGPYTVNGVPIIEMMDGPVCRVVGNDLVVAPNPGALAEIYISEEQIVKNIRIQTARMPVMNYPGAIVYAKIYTA